MLTGHDQTDLRFGFLGSTRIGAGGAKPQTQIDASLTHYSRYLNTIAYGNVAHDFFLGSPLVRGVVGADTALDTSRAFYNNAVEGFAGVKRAPAESRCADRRTAAPISIAVSICPLTAHVLFDSSRTALWVFTLSG